MDLPTIGRDVFLDHHGEKSELPMILQKQFEVLKKIARKRGHVVAICHPYKETYRFLLKNIPTMQDEFELVKLSDLMRKPLLLQPDLIDSEMIVDKTLSKLEIEKTKQESLLN